MSGGAGWEWRQREYDQIPLERLRVNPPAAPAREDYDPTESDDGPPDPPLDARWVEHERHVFRAKPENANREKAHDAFGRWYFKDTGGTY